MKIALLLSLIGLVIIGLSCSLPSEKENKSTPIEITKHVKPYLMFPGTCRQALHFYAECFDGEIVMMQTFAESPVEVPAEFNQRIFNAEFRADSLRFMASDDLPGNEVTVGSNFALFVVFSDAAEKEKVFNRLSERGKVLFPIEDNFGMLVDKFGIQWMVESRN